jgi:hypothetical protein
MSLRRADPSSRAVLPTVVCVWVWSSEHKQPRHLLWIGRRGKDYETKRNKTKRKETKRNKTKPTRVLQITLNHNMSSNLLSFTLPGLNILISGLVGYYVARYKFTDVWRESAVCFVTTCLYSPLKVGSRFLWTSIYPPTYTASHPRTQ